MMKAKNSIMPVIPIKRRNVLRSIQMKYNYFNPGVNINPVIGYLPSVIFILLTFHIF